MGQRIRAFDWTQTPLGMPATWPQPLKTLVNLLLVSTQPMFLAWGPQRTWLYNDAFTPILGHKHPTALGRPSMDVWDEARDILEPLFDLVFEGEPVSIKDFSLGLDRNGTIEESHFEFAYTPARDEDGSVRGLFGTCIETTARIMAERAQATATKRQRQQFQRAPSFIAILTGPDHIFEFVNESYVRLLGEREYIGKSVRDVIPEVEGQGFFELLDRVYQTGERYIAQQTPITFLGGKNSVPTRHYLDFVYEPILDERQQISGIFVEGFDVTETYQAQERLRELNQTLERRVEKRTTDLRNIQTFYTHTSECHAILSRREDGQFQYDEVNPATLRLYKMTREQVIGHTVNEIFDAERAKEITENLVESLRRNTPYRYMRRLKSITVEAISTPIPTEPGERPRVAVTARDITNRINLEEQLRQAQKMEAVGQLTGGLAHDFNNILQGIGGALDRVRHRIQNGRVNEVEKFLTAAIDSTNRAASLTHRLLAFSRRQTLDPKHIDANSLIASMEDLINRTMGPNIAVTFAGEPNLWVTRIDPPQLENALLNLSINARDAMPDGGKLTIETANVLLDESEAKEREIAPGEYVSLNVTDTGTGMPPDVVARAFDPFYTTKPLGLGTGLGLSMVYGFVRQSGGQVCIETEIGEGTTIRLYLPRHTGGIEQNLTEPSEQPGKGFGETILLVDDEQTVRMLITEVLTESLYSVLEAKDGSAAMKILETDQSIDLLITDVGLPGNMNGRQIADAARMIRKDLKVLFITGYADHAVLGKQHLEPGMEILIKPFEMSKLANKVRHMFDRKT